MVLEAVLLAILVMLQNGTSYQYVNPQASSYGLVTYPPNYAVAYSHIIGSGTYMMYVSPGSYYSISVVGPGPLGLYMHSNTTVVLQVMNQANYERFRLGEVYQALFTFVGSSINTTVSLDGAGNYYVVISNNYSSMASVEIALIQHYPTAFINAPVGIVDYGLAPTPSGFIPYSYTTSEFVGNAKIYSVDVQPLTNCSPLPPGSLSLQLNAVLEVVIKGHTQYYWLQDVIILDPNDNQLLPLVNVWNMSSPEAGMNPLYVVGHGFVVNNQTYVYVGNWTLYTTEPSISLSIYVNRTTNGYPSMLFSYSLNGEEDLVDNVTLLLKPSWGPYLVVNGSTYTPLGYLADAEFVVGGPGCGAVVLARKLNMSLSLYYLSPGGDLLPVPTVWSFGSDTGETIVNAHVVPTGPATVQLTTGSEYLGPLTNADYVFFLSLSNYLTNGTLVNENIPLPAGSRVLITTEKELNFGNGTMIQLVGAWINGVPINGTTIALTMNRTYIINYVWAKYYWLQVIDETGQVNNASGWYLVNSIVNITVPRTIIYLNNDTRLVLSEFTTNSTYYLTSANSVVLLINAPTHLILDWSKEYNVSVTLYTINGVPITTEYLGWLPEGYELTNITIDGITYETEKALIVTKPNLTATLDAEYEVFTVRDTLGIPEPLTTVSIVCNGQEITTTTNALGQTPRVLTPINATCTITSQPLGYYSALVIAAALITVAIVVRRGRGKYVRT